MGKNDGLTPMQKQYNKIKAENKDAILFFRLGDFYEMFGEDAIKAHKILGIVLTKRNKGALNQMSMCGIPYHSAENYINKLTKEGLKVAICEQTSDPNLPGIVERKVVRIITPGTTLNDNLLITNENNYLVSILKEKEEIALAYIDLSTGIFNVTQTNNEELIRDELFRLNPSEMIVRTNDINYTKELISQKSFFYEYDTYRNLEEVLLEHYKIKNLNIFGLNTNLSKQVSGFILQYLIDTQMNEIAHLKRPNFYSLDDYMHIDDSSIRNLELLRSNIDNKKEGSLLNTIDKTITAMGGRKLRDYITKPLLDKTVLKERYEAVDEFLKKQTELKNLREILKNILDIERILGRVGCLRSNARDLIFIKESLKELPKLIKNLKQFGNSRLIKKLLNKIDILKNLEKELDLALIENPPNEITEGGIIKDSYDKDLSKYLYILKKGKDLLIEIQQKEQIKTGIDTLKIRYNRVFGYYIEISKAKAKNLPSEYTRKQTLVNAERFTTVELKELEEKILTAKEKSTEKEYEIFCKIRSLVIENLEKIQNNAEIIAKIDVLQSFAFKALYSNYSKPKFVKENSIKIEKGRHPVVEEITELGKFIPNDTYLSSKRKYISLLTGPNMSGKSTYLRQISLIVLLAQIGSFVPANNLEFSIVDCIFTRVGASDNLSKGQSTFMVEMQETSYILNHATENSLIILDEIGRGTSTYDGLSIAWSILEHIHDTIKSKTIFATHYHELIEVAENLMHAENISVAVKEFKGKIIFLYNVKKGGINKSYGIEVSKLAGLPKKAITRAKQILHRLEKDQLRLNLKNKISINQETLFLDNLYDSSKENKDEELIKELKDIEIEKLTPLEALNKINELKKKIT